MPNIVLKDRNGNPVVYQGILTVSFNDENGKIVRYAYIKEDEPTGTTAKIENNQLILNGATIDESNNLSLEMLQLMSKEI